MDRVYIVENLERFWRFLDRALDDCLESNFGLLRRDYRV